MSNKVTDIEARIKQKEAEMEQLKQKTTFSPQQPESQVTAPYASHPKMVAASYSGQSESAQQRQSQFSNTYQSQLGTPGSGPTSFTAVGGHYNKRSQYAVMNDNVNQRISENSQFVQQQKQTQQKGTIGWGSYNYPSSF